MSINVRPWVLDLANCLEDWWDAFVALLDQVDECVVLDVFFGKIFLVKESWVCVSKHCVSVARNNTAFSDRVEHVLLDLLISDVVTKSSFHFKEPLENFLVGKPVQWACESIKTSGVRKIGICQSRTHQVCSMS